MDGWDILEQAAELSRRGEEFALATVVWRQGPSSGQPGSRALITADGQVHGWIGGACAEPVVVRQARQVMADRQPKLLLLGDCGLDHLSGRDDLPEGMVAVPISCQSEGALQVYIEPVVPTPHLVIVGRSPMAHTLADLATALGWRTEVHNGPDFSAAVVNTRSIVVVATQGHGDEEAIEQAVSAFPAFVGVVASRKRGEALLGTLVDRGVPRNLLDRVRVPVGLDLGHTSHREIAVAILAELVQRRSAGELVPSADAVAAPVVAEAIVAEAIDAEAIDPVCGMTVRADSSSHPYEHDGITYHFCCAGCRTRFAKDPAAFLTTQEA
jgi:xanthine dehydrogenase accessory factor